MVARPVSGPAVPDMKMLGAAPWMLKLKLLLMPAGVWIDMVPLPVTLNGNCAFIWPLETNSSGMGVPLTVRQDSPSAVGSGIWEVAIFTGLICEPYRSEEHTSELQSLRHLVCRLLLEKRD